MPKYPIMFIIAMPDLNPASCSSADSSIVSARKSSFGKDAKKNSFTSSALLGSLSFTINEPVSPFLFIMSRKVSMWTTAV